MRFLIAMAMLAVGAAQAQAPPKNILVILTDDQRWDTAAYMPNLQSIAADGVTFTNALQPTPLCGPSRSMLLSGGYHSQDTGVLGNAPPNGGFPAFHDANNIGVMLQGAGYTTMFIGKWINGYEGRNYYIPPGWSTWVGRATTAISTDWYHFKYVVGTSTNVKGLNKGGVLTPATDYTTYWERDQVLAKINAAKSGTQPFFILWAPSAPHAPAQPANEDKTLFSDFIYRDRGVGETDKSDKPLWVQNFKALPDNSGRGDEYVRNTLRALQAVDRSFQALVDQLKANGQWDNTLVIFTSDNGYMWNEHGLWEKQKPYQEALHVPFIVHMPGVEPRADANLIAPSLDIGATVYELAGVNKLVHGMSIVPLLNDPATPWRTELFIEEQDNNISGPAIYAGVVTGSAEYARYWSGEEELYDLVADPFQLQSLHADPAYADQKAALAADTTAQLGLAVIPVNNFKSGKLGSTYTAQLLLWGGFGPFTWKVETGALPPGLTIDPATGLISGTPTTAGTYKFALRVTDSAISPQTLQPHTFTGRATKLTIN